MATPINPSSPQPVATNGSREATAGQQATAATQRQQAAPGGNAAPAPAPAAEVAEAARDISQLIQTVNRSLQISVDQDLGRTVITVLDSETDEVIRQIPQEELVELARFIAEQREQLAGGDRAPVRGLLADSQG